MGDDESQLFANRYKIDLDEKHQYDVRIMPGDIPLDTEKAKKIISATKFVHGVAFEELNSAIFASRMGPDSSMSKYGTTDHTAIVKVWDDFRDYKANLGTKMHAAVEHDLRAVIHTMREKNIFDVSAYELMPLQMNDNVLRTNEEVKNPPPPEPGSFEEDIIKAFPPDNVRVMATNLNRVHRIVYRVPKTPPKFDADNGVVVTELALRTLRQHLIESNLVPVAVERRMFSERLLIAGTFDALFRDVASGEYYLYDWKRWDHWEPYGDASGRTEYGVDRFSDLVKNHYSEALLQLHIYRHLLLRGEGIESSHLRLVQLYPGLVSSDGIRRDLIVHDLPVSSRLADEFVATRLEDLGIASEDSDYERNWRRGSGPFVRV
jgi:hypothetical protein